MQALISKPVGFVARCESSTVLPKYKSLSGFSSEESGNSTIFYDSNQLGKEALAIWKKLNSFKKLEDNWDSYRASKPSDISLEKAIDFVKEMDHFGLPFYFTAPGVNGEAMIELKGLEDKAAEIYFNSDGSSELLLFSGEECVLEGTFDEHKKELVAFFND